MFRGIPFAEPPIGPLRFREPIAVKPWKGEHDATQFPAAAVQSGLANVKQSEDCLYLNVWAPEGKGPFPVFVWIHGGGFTGGYSFDPVFDGAKFARDGIICITVAYRLGVLGFLDMGPLLGGDYNGSANNGLRDLIAALQWVRGNVSAFGGDPDRVTVGGESAGAKLTGLLMGAPEARPLFHQMISESGGAERIWPKEAALAVSSGFGDLWKREDNGEADLSKVPAAKLMEAQRKFIAKWPQHFPLRAELDGALFHKLPVQAVAAGLTKGKRLLIGTNQDESASFIGPHPSADAAAGDLGNMPLAQFQKSYQKYAQVYPLLTTEQLRVRAVTAEEYWIPSIQLADAHVQGGGSAWMYRLDLVETSGRLKGYAYHGLDVGLVWNAPHPQIENAAAEASLATKVHLAWVAFIQGKTPGAPGLPEWTPYRAGTRPTMILDVESRLETKPHEAELRLW